MALQLGSESATLAVGATPVSRVYRAGRLDFLRVTLGGSDYIISGIMYESVGNAENAAKVPLLTASPWYGNQAIAEEMDSFLLEFSAVPFPGLANVLQPDSGIAGGIGPLVRVGGAVLQFNGFDYLTPGGSATSRFYRADTGVVFNGIATASLQMHLVGRPA